MYWFGVCCFLGQLCGHGCGSLAPAHHVVRVHQRHEATPGGGVWVPSHHLRDEGWVEGQEASQCADKSDKFILTFVSWSGTLALWTWKKNNSFLMELISTMHCQKHRSYFEEVTGVFSEESGEAERHG